MFDYLRDHYRRPDQIRAIDLLSDPEAYPGLPEQDGNSFRLQVYVMPSFTPITSWTLFKRSDDEFLVRRVRWDFAADYRAPMGEPTTYGSDAILEALDIQTRISKLESISFPAFAEEECFGIDGTTFGIRRGRSGHRSEFCWWCRPPMGCELIAEWHQDFSSFIDQFLPAHTDTDRQQASRPKD